MSEGNITGRIYEGPAKEKIQYVRGTESRFNITKKKKKQRGLHYGCGFAGYQVKITIQKGKKLWVPTKEYLR